jgi:hypothetical protein
MRWRSSGIRLALAVVLALLAGCSSGSASDRTPGDPITQAEAGVLADVLHKDFERGGADFTLTAPFAEGSVLTLTGSIDFQRSVGKAKAVTTYSNGQPTETRTLYFTPADIWFGDVPGLSAALTSAGLPQAGYIRRPLAGTTSNDTGGAIIDVMVQLVPRLSARTADDPRSFTERNYTWQGDRSINGHLASVYRSGTGSTIAVEASSKLLVQYVTKLPDQDFDVTITLSNHGKRQIDLPSDAQTVNAADHPDVAQAVGV